MLLAKRGWRRGKEVSLGVGLDRPPYAFPQIYDEIAEQVECDAQMVEAFDWVVESKNSREVTDVSVGSWNNQSLQEVLKAHFF